MQLTIITLFCVLNVAEANKSIIYKCAIKEKQMPIDFTLFTQIVVHRRSVKNVFLKIS